LYDKIFETQSRKSQFMKRITALCIRQYYSDRLSDDKGISTTTYVYLVNPVKGRTASATFRHES